MLNKLFKKKKTRIYASIGWFGVLYITLLTAFITSSFNQTLIMFFVSGAAVTLLFYLGIQVEKWIEKGEDE